LDASKRHLELAIDFYCDILQIDRKEFLARVREACDRKRPHYVKLAALREEIRKAQERLLIEA
jgi:hypothetical protein